MKDIDRTINTKLSEEEKRENETGTFEKRVPKDQTQEAIENIRKYVKELLEIDDLKASREANPKLYDNRMLTIIAWFDYLKWHKSNSSEFEEAKKLLLSIGKKHPKIAEWVDDVITKEKPEPPVSLWGAELNVDKTNELIIDANAKIVVDSEEAKKLIDKECLIGSKEYNELQYNYDVIVNGKKYEHLCHIVKYIPKCDLPEDCPYIVHLIDWEKKANGTRVLRFSVLEK